MRRTRETFTLNLNKKDIVYKSASGKLGNIGVDSNTIIFDIPTGAGTDTDKYSVRNNSSLSNDTSYDIMVYDLQDNYMAKVIIITSTTGTTSAESPIVVVDHMSETQNADYDTTDRLYGWEGGKEVEHSRRRQDQYCARSRERRQKSLRRAILFNTAPTLTAKSTEEHYCLTLMQRTPSLSIISPMT